MYPRALGSSFNHLDLNYLEMNLGSKPLVKNLDGLGPSRNFRYSSVVGMMRCLARHTRPDITCEVNCCARYMFCPQHYHKLSLKRIDRYLNGKSTNGFIIKPYK